MAALAEEWGWRGWLLPHLMRLGTWPALLLSGVIWGAWHAPLTLRGYNYPELGAWAAPVFVVFCVVVGTLLGWVLLAAVAVVVVKLRPIPMPSHSVTQLESDIDR